MYYLQLLELSFSREALHIATGTYSIGRLAELTGLPIKTIRFYSDEGLLPSSSRTTAGHRRYGESDLARLQLIRALRDLGLDLPSIAEVLEGRTQAAEIVAAHGATLETRIRGLQRQLAVLRAVDTSSSEDTVRRTQQLANLDATERRQLLDHFWDRALEGAPDAAVAARFRAMGSPDLPAQPTQAQLDAWLELAELAVDEDFQQTTRRNATWLPDAADGEFDMAAVGAGMDRALERAGEAVPAGVVPDSTDGRAVVDGLAVAYATSLHRQDNPEFRRWLRDEMDRHTDPRAARYWELVNVVRGAGAADSPQDAARRSAGAWLWEAMRAAMPADA